MARSLPLPLPLHPLQKTYRFSQGVSFPCVAGLAHLWQINGPYHQWYVMDKPNTFVTIRRVAIMLPQIVWVVVKVLIYMLVFVICGLIAVAKDDLERP